MLLSSVVPLRELCHGVFSTSLVCNKVWRECVLEEVPGFTAEAAAPGEAPGGAKRVESFCKLGMRVTPDTAFEAHWSAADVGHAFAMAWVLPCIDAGQSEAGQLGCARPVCVACELGPG